MSRYVLYALGVPLDRYRLQRAALAVKKLKRKMDVLTEAAQRTGCAMRGLREPFEHRREELRELQRAESEEAIKCAE